MPSGLIRRISDTISRHNMWRPGGRVGVGVSGGSDSVALLRVLKELCEPQGIRLAVVHFNHCLRGPESEADERFVAALAGRFELPFISGREDVAAVARTQRWNLEDAARRLRYGFFDSLIADGRIECVAVAHTADDQAETVLGRIFRGTGLTGLCAIYPVNGKIVRPLLEVRREELREYLKHLGEEWREDPTNFDRSRLRSQLRHDVLPLLEDRISPAVVSHLNRLATMSREDEAFWQAFIQALLSTAVERAEGQIRIRCSDLLNPLPAAGWMTDAKTSEDAQLAVSRRLVRGIVDQARGHRRQWNAAHVARVLRLARVGTSGSRLELPGVIVERNFDWLQFTAAGEAGENVRGRRSTKPAVISEFSCVVQLGSAGDSTVIAVPEIRRRFRLKVVDWHQSRSDTDTGNAVDRALLVPPLVLRNWQPGDCLRPKGRLNCRKLKHFLRIKRVELAERASWPVLTSGDMLVWTRGLPVAAEFATRSSTRLGVIIAEENL